MKMHPLSSSVIKAVGYDYATKDLYIEFYNGTNYAYHQVPQTTYHELLEAESAGQFFNKHIKPNYKFSTVQEGQIEYAMFESAIFFRWMAAEAKTERECLVSIVNAGFYFFTQAQS